MGPAKKKLGRDMLLCADCALFLGTANPTHKIHELP
jgi:hypothetical protein